MASGEGDPRKIGELFGDGVTTGLGKYRAFAWGDVPWHRALLAEVLTFLLGPMPGAAGLWLRRKLYPSILGAVGRGFVIGRNVTIRHPHKVRVGERVIVDDNVVLDAKGGGSGGITLGDGVFLGRNTILYCKGGEIVVGDGVSFSANCQVVSALRVSLGPDTVVGSFSYFLSGGGYDTASPVPFARQDGQFNKAALTIGPNCWVGAGVTVMEGADVGEHCVLGAGAVVTEPVPPHSVAVGIPARVVRKLEPPAAPTAAP